LLSTGSKYPARKIELQVFGDNAAAIALYQKLGFQPEGCKHRVLKIDGQYQDIMLMALMLENLSHRTDIAP
jgi:L-phenylalanine/L-methionine N-acetyltransferase